LSPSPSVAEEGACALKEVKFLVDELDDPLPSPLSRTFSPLKPFQSVNLAEAIQEMWREDDEGTLEVYTQCFLHQIRDMFS
jgi:hypothetical protein